jgi:hypothetical protein
MFVSSTAFAATDGNRAALSQGRPASVKQAESYDSRNLPCWILGAGIVIGGIVLIATGNSHGTVGNTTVCPLGGCPAVQTTQNTSTSTSTATTTSSTTSSGTH